MISTFGAFTTARLGMIASQKALDLTGHNIANINTNGYTRQRLDQYSFYSGGSGLYRSGNNANPGSGVIVSGISQIRDPYLDIRYRKEASSVGSMDARLTGLEDLKSILDEVNDTVGPSNNGIKAQLEAMYKQLNDLNNNSGSKDFDTLFRATSETLATLLKSASSDLQDSLKSAQDKYTQDVGAANDILKSIQELNKEIRNGDVHGSPSLELRDERNLLIDELAQYMKIDVVYDKEDVGAGVQIERMTIKVADSARPAPTLIEGVNRGNLSVNADKYKLQIDGLTQPDGTVVDPTVPAIVLQDGQMKGALEATRDILNGTGEFTTDGSNKQNRGIPYYQKSLDSLANKLATTMNQLNTTAPDGTPFAGDPKFPGAGDLFQTDDGSTTITANNISVSDGWKSGAIHVITSLEGTDQSNGNSNINRFLALMTTKLEYKPSDIDATPGASGDAFFSGTFEEMFTNINTVLGSDIKTTQSIYNTYLAKADEINVNRDSISGVDLNEEGTNLMQYQKSFAAACRLMTTLDEALDKVINGMGVVGR